MKDLPKVLPFLFYGDATKNATNQISHILQRSTSPPQLENFPLPPMLPHIWNENIQYQKIISTEAPALRVEPVLQPPRAQTQYSAPTPPPIEWPSKYPSLDPPSNPWIKRFEQYKETPHIPKARKEQAEPRKCQHQLLRSQSNIGTNFHTQAEQHLVANH